MFSITFSYNVPEKNKINKIFSNDISITNALHGVPKLINFDFKKYKRQITYQCKNKKELKNYIKRASDFNKRNKKIKLNWFITNSSKN